MRLADNSEGKEKVIPKDRQGSTIDRPSVISNLPESASFQITPLASLFLAACNRIQLIKLSYRVPEDMIIRISKANHYAVVTPVNDVLDPAHR